MRQILVLAALFTLVAAIQAKITVTPAAKTIRVGDTLQVVASYINQSLAAGPMQCRNGGALALLSQSEMVPSQTETRVALTVRGQHAGVCTIDFRSDLAKGSAHIKIVR